MGGLSLGGLSFWGPFCFGAIVGWYVYFINRYRKGDVGIGDISALVGAIGGAAVTALFDPKGELFAAYGVGLFCGFFAYFACLIALVRRSENFNSDWFLDGRRKKPVEPFEIPGDIRQTVAPMSVLPDGTRVVGDNPGARQQIHVELPPMTLVPQPPAALAPAAMPKTGPNADAPPGKRKQGG